MENKIPESPGNDMIPGQGWAMGLLLDYSDGSFFTFSKRVGSDSVHCCVNDEEGKCNCCITTFMYF